MSIVLYHSLPTHVYDYRYIVLSAGVDVSIIVHSICPHSVESVYVAEPVLIYSKFGMCVGSSYISI